MGEKEKWRNKGTNKQQQPDSVYMVHLPTIHVCTKFQSSSPHSFREKCDKKFQCWKLERKKNEENIANSEQSHIPPAIAIRGMLKQFCRCKFLMLANWWDRKKEEKISRPHSYREISDKNFKCLKIGKKNKRIKGWISNSSLIPVYMIHTPTVHVYQVSIF